MWREVGVGDECRIAVGVYWFDRTASAGSGVAGGDLNAGIAGEGE
jgi:hypothetical protein